MKVHFFIYLFSHWIKGMCPKICGNWVSLIILWYELSYWRTETKKTSVKTKMLIQLNLSITAIQWRSKKWSLQAGDLYIEGPSSAGHFIYFLSRHFPKDCYHNISQLFEIVDFKYLWLLNDLVIKRNNYLLFLPIQINSISFGIFIIGMHKWPLYTG